MTKYIKNQHFTYALRSYFPLPVRLVGWVMIIGFTYQTIADFNPIFLLPALLGVLVVFSKISAQVDLRLKLYRFTFSLLGWHSGKWISFDRVEYLNIFPTRTSQRIGSYQTGAITELKDFEVRINLIYSNRKRDMIFSTNSSNEALNLGMELGEHLKLDVYDCTGEENRWVRFK
ncbi:MAG: hypothetical protein JJ975_04570 [Bacteroidia bacterium]|nr:hypothetical protein [Bacteroidia bacterium]